MTLENQASYLISRLYLVFLRVSQLGCIHNYVASYSLDFEIMKVGAAKPTLLKINFRHIHEPFTWRVLSIYSDKHL